MQRLTPDNCKQLQDLGVPVDIANGSFVKMNGNYCYCNIPYILNSKVCIPCWSLNNLFEVIKPYNIALNSKENKWELTVEHKTIKKFIGNTVFEVVYNAILNIFKK